MSQTSTKFCILVYLVYTLASQEVKAVKVLCVRWEEKLLLRVLHRDTGLEDSTFAFLNPLTHRVKVGGEVARCWVDTLTILTLRLTEQLLPPLHVVVQLWLIVHENLNLLAVSI